MKINNHYPLLGWLLLISAIFICAIITWHLDIFSLLLLHDVSRISVVIILIFICASIHAAYYLIYFSKETELLSQWIRKYTSHSKHGKSLPVFDELIGLKYLHSFLITTKHHYFWGNKSLKMDESNFLEVIKTKLKAPVKLGWLLADLLIKLGLLGTIIGFILMLSSISNLESIDPSNIKILFTSMSTGMRTALFTTLSGLVTGTLLGFQYYIVEQSADTLISHTVEFFELVQLAEVPAAQAQR